MSGDVTDMLLAAVERGDADEVADQLIALPERQRRTAGGALRDRAIRPLEGRRWGAPAVDVRHTAQAVWFGTGIARELRWSQFQLVGFDGTYPRLHEVLAARPTRVRDGLVRTMLVEDPHLFWHVVHRLVDDGLVDMDVEVEYLEAMIRWLGYPGFEDGVAVEPVQHIVDQLASDVGLVERLWRAFELERVVETMSTQVFADALVRAAARGAIDRVRLLAVAIDGLLRDLRPGTSGFFRRIAVGLDPSPTELRRHADALLRVLANGHPAEQRQVAVWLRQMSTHGEAVDVPALVAAAATPLSGRHKSAAIETLRLLAAATPAMERARAAVPGLGHEHQEVQARALDLVEQAAAAKLLSTDLRAELLTYADSVVPALRSRLTQVVGSELAPVVRPDEGEAEVELDDLATRIERLPGGVRDALALDRALAAVRAGERPPPAVFTTADVPWRGHPVAAVADVEELVELLTLLLAGSGDAIDLERAIDGIARTHWRELTPGASAALRAASAWEPHGWGGWEARDLVLAAVHHWRQGLVPPRPVHLQRAARRSGLTHDLAGAGELRREDAWMRAFDGIEEVSGLTGFVSGRLWEATVAGVRAPRPTLSLPTTDEGWLDVEELLGRLVRRGSRDRPGRYDAVQALLRLHPQDRPPTGRRPRGAVAAAVAAWCDPGAPAPDDEGLARAVRERHLMPDGLVGAAVRHVHSYRGEVQVVRFAVPPPTTPRRRDDPVGELHAELVVPDGPIDIDGWWTPYASALPPADRLLAGWSLVALPRHRMLLSCRAVSLLAEDPDQNRSSDAVDTLVADLAGPDRPLDRGAHSLVAAALISRNDAVGAAGVDVVAAASDDGRLDPEALGVALVELAEAGVARSSRVADRLGRVVGASVPTADAVRIAVQTWLAGLPQLPHDAHAPLELLERACDVARCGIDLAAARAALGSASSGRSKRARAAGRLLASPSAPHGPTSSGARLEVQVRRGERWAEVIP